MPIGDISLPDTIHQIDGVDIGTTAAGVRYQNREDLVIFRLCADANVAVVTTQNAFCAAPVHILREHITTSPNVRYLLVNTGNANAGTGTEGLNRALATCQALADITQCSVQNVLPYSTGVIGEALNSDAIIDGLKTALSHLSSRHWRCAADAIRTTDTISKVASEALVIDGVRYHVTGISKGAGMIRPNMATMLGFVATNANIAPDLLKAMLNKLVNASFNRITVDGDTSTNDCCTLIATGKASTELIDSENHPHYPALFAVLQKVFLRLAQLIVRDGEGATKFITVAVTGGQTTQECCDVAYAVAHSPLVKTAFFASDPNWGRILAAVGYAEVTDLETTNIEVHLDEVLICQRGERFTEYTEEQGQAVMTRPEITITINLNRGDAKDTVYTCDLSYDYVKINSDYRS